MKLKTDYKSRLSSIHQCIKRGFTEMGFDKISGFSSPAGWHQGDDSEFSNSNLCLSRVITR